jgi:hypothetical protein
LRIEALEERYLLSADVVLQWNQAVLQAIRNDKPTIGFVTRDLAIVHTAIYDAINAIDHTSSTFHVQAAAPADASAVAAADAAGLFTASALFPTDTALFQATFQAALADVPAGPAQADGIAVGRFAAEQTLIGRVTDGANAFVPYTPGTNPGDWRPTPSAFAAAQTPQWPFVTPFALDSGSQFRPGPPPALTSSQYTAAFNEVKALGRVDSTVRTPQETEVARFWEAKAGTPQIAGYWNLIAENAATSQATSQANTLDQDARLFAELNVALADETIAFFDAKYTYNRWRPVTAIQLADQTGNPDTVADPNWLPLLNTANHPSWVSAHGGISGAAATVLANFFGTDNISFNLTSEDLKGVTHSFASFSAAATEAENSVVWSGGHFRFDVTAGHSQGQAVAQFVDQHFFQPQLSLHAPLVPSLGNGTKQTFSTVPANGDQNPYGVAFVPADYRGGGKLQPGDILVSNFNNQGDAKNPGGLQGTGTTIELINPTTGQTSVFFQGPKGLGLTTALGILKDGFVIVGNVPTKDGKFDTIKKGSLLVLDSNGTIVETLNSKQLLDGPWDLAINDQGNHAQVFVSNVLSGTVTRIDLTGLRHGGAPVVRDEVRIASGYAHAPNDAALVVGPTGLAYDAQSDILYVASTADNAVFAIHNAGQTQRDRGKGKLIYHDDAHLHGPLGLVLAPNGDLITANGDAVHADPNQPSALVEFTPTGKFVGQFSVDPGTGGAFGIALQASGGELRFAAVDDNSNTLDVWSFQVAPQPHGGGHHGGDGGRDRGAASRVQGVLDFIFALLSPSAKHHANAGQDQDLMSFDDQDR